MKKLMILTMLLVATSMVFGQKVIRDSLLVKGNIRATDSIKATIIVGNSSTATTAANS